MSFWKRDAQPQPEPETVACRECGHIVLKSTATPVRQNYGDVWYCREHRKPYDNYYAFPSSVYHQNGVYYRRMQVDKFGVPFGYVKATKGGDSTIS